MTLSRGCFTIRKGCGALYRLGAMVASGTADNTTNTTSPNEWISLCIRSKDLIITVYHKKCFQWKSADFDFTAIAEPSHQSCPFSEHAPV
jgi:hypothetical protein